MCPKTGQNCLGINNVDYLIKIICKINLIIYHNPIPNLIFYGIIYL